MQAAQAEETATDKNITLWVAVGVLAVALAGMTVVVIQSKKKKKEE